MGKAPRVAKPANGGKPPAAAKPVEPDAEDAEALLGSLNHSAERLQTLWISFILYCFYVAIAASGTTHRMLLLEEPINLPVVNLPLPLVPFYIVAPITLLVFHFYLLMMLVLLARTAKQFDDVVRVEIPDTDARENMRFRMENSLFLQMVAGAERERKGWNGRWLQLVATVTVVAAPIAALMLTQAMFIPYHSSFVTWFHRGVVLADLIAVLCFWPSFHGKGGERYWPGLDWRLAYIVPVCLAIFLFSGIVLTFPGEWAHEKAREFAALEDNVTHCDWSNYMPPNCLSLVGEDFVDDDGLRKMFDGNKLLDGTERWQPVRDLRGRNLSHADLSYTDLRHSDFSSPATVLVGANFSNAWLDYSRFEYEADLRGTHFGFAQMAKTRLSTAQLQGAQFLGTVMPGAVLSNANLDGAIFFLAELQVADLTGVLLHGAALRSSHLQGADLTKAQIEGSSFIGSQLQGANLREATIKGTDLSFVGLEGVQFGETTVFASNVDYASFYRNSNDGRSKIARNRGAPSFSANLVLYVDGISHNIASKEGFESYLKAVSQRLKDSTDRNTLAKRLGVLDPLADWKGLDVQSMFRKSDLNRRTAHEQASELRFHGLMEAACHIPTKEALNTFLRLAAAQDALVIASRLNHDRQNSNLGCPSATPVMRRLIDSFIYRVK